MKNRLPALPDSPPPDDDPNDPHDADGLPADLDDDPWDAFIPDDDYEPLPEPGDFWTEQDAA